MSEKLDAISEKLLKFRRERDWEQFHDPKNLAEAISIESAELLEVFLWKKAEESRQLSNKDLQKVKEESADIFIFLSYLSKELGFDLLEAVEQKIQTNSEKYPVEKSKGTAKKYNEL